MSIISKVDKSRSLSIEFDTNQLTNIGNRKQSIAQFLMLFDFNRFQLTSIGNTKNDACQERRRQGTHTFICELCLIIFKGKIKHAYCFLESFFERRKLSFNVEMVRCFIFFFDILNIQSLTLRLLHNAALFDSGLCLQINNQLKTL